MAKSRIDRDRVFVDTYLQFLGIKAQDPSLTFLSELLMAHLKKVPFDASHFALRQPEKYTLKKKEIMQHVLNGGGAVCYQMHAIFRKLLCLLGFDCLLASARVFRYGRGLRPSEQDSHCVLLATLESKEFIIDLTWGNPMRTPMPVGGEIVCMTGDLPHRSVIINGEYQLQVKIDAEWLKEYSFQKMNVPVKSFAAQLAYLSTPGIHTADSVLLMRYNEHGDFEFTRKWLYRDHHCTFTFFRTKADGTEVEEQIDQQDAVSNRLARFGVDEDNRREIWNICTNH